MQPWLWRPFGRDGGWYEKSFQWWRARGVVALASSPSFSLFMTTNPNFFLSFCVCVPDIHRSSSAISEWDTRSPWIHTCLCMLACLGVCVAVIIMWNAGKGPLSSLQSPSRISPNTPRPPPSLHLPFPSYHSDPRPWDCLGQALFLNGTSVNQCHCNRVNYSFTFKNSSSKLKHFWNLKAWNKKWCFLMFLISKMVVPRQMLNFFEKPSLIILKII